MSAEPPRGAATLRQVEVNLLVSSWFQARINAPVRWVSAGPRRDTELVVSHGKQFEGVDQLRILMSVNRFRPTEPRLQYVYRRGWLRRLCVNRAHGDLAGTHKHYVTGPGAAGAYEPDDIPILPNGPHVSSDGLRAILEAFAAECSITLGPAYAWTPPWKGA